MLIQPSQIENSKFAYRTQRLWNDARRFTKSLGCTNCVDLENCGGLSVGSAIFDCLTMCCCQNPPDCDAVCRAKPEEFVQRVREIGGFGLDNVPRADAPRFPELPVLIPVIFHGNKRSQLFAGPGIVCLPLYRLVDSRTGAIRYSSEQQLKERFGLKRGTRIVLTGTSTDPALERWWSLGSNRLQAIRGLKELNVSLVTTPNYSLFTDQPRWDDLHSIKRIALAHQEFLSLGLPAALHVNARTERDWERWVAFVASRPEITHLAFEFATGAGWAGRTDWHLQRLRDLQTMVGRRLHLVIRGGARILPQLATAYDNLTCLETSVFVKTMRRKAAVIDSSGKVRWRHAPTDRDESLDLLLEHNWEIVSQTYTCGNVLTDSRKVA